MILKAENLCKTYKEGSVIVDVIKNVSISIERGETVVIMGPSGSGKTTLLSMMGCILKPTSGRLVINDIDVTELSEDRLPYIRNNFIGFVFQTFNLFPSLTVLENVEIALNLKKIKRKKAREKAAFLLEKVGLKDRLNFLPRDLSGGQKQRVSIARAIAGEPPLILADEPTGNLDSKSGHEAVTVLRELSKDNKSAVVIVTHNIRISDVADRILYLEDGEIIRLGGSAEADRSKEKCALDI